MCNPHPSGLEIALAMRHEEISPRSPLLDVMSQDQRARVSEGSSGNIQAYKIIERPSKLAERTPRATKTRGRLGVFLPAIRMSTKQLNPMLWVGAFGCSLAANQNSVSGA